MRIHAGWLWLLLAPTWLTAAQLPDGDIVPAPELPQPRAVPSRGLPSKDVPPGDLTPKELPAKEGREKAPQGREQAVDPWAAPLPTCSVEELKESFLKLRAEREKLQAERLSAASRRSEEASLAQENLKLRLRLSEVLVRFSGRGNTKGAPAALPEHRTNLTKTTAPARTTPQAPQAALPAEHGTEAPTEQNPENLPLDPLALGLALFKTGDYEGALRAYRLVDLRGMKANERLPIQYLTGTCLKRLGKTDQAAGVYREIASSRGDQDLAACAQWQLSVIDWQAELQAQLEAIRQRRKAMENRP